MEVAVLIALSMSGMNELYRSIHWLSPLLAAKFADIVSRSSAKRMSAATEVAAIMSLEASSKELSKTILSLTNAQTRQAVDRTQMRTVDRAV
jgi:hypothetical protein